MPAGTLKWHDGWMFMLVLFLPMIPTFIWLLKKDPQLLKKRLDAKEEQSEQKSVIVLSGLMYIAGFLLAGFNYRFSWLSMPNWIKFAACCVFIFAYRLYVEVLHENTYLSRTVKVEENQKVIDTGLYGIVRHPMYSVTLFMFLSVPLILGSPLSFLIFLTYPLIICKRIKNEEEVLKTQLAGYEDYCKKVAWRLIPKIW